MFFCLIGLCWRKAQELFEEGPGLQGLCIRRMSVADQKPDSGGKNVLGQQDRRLALTILQHDCTNIRLRMEARDPCCVSATEHE